MRRHPPPLSGGRTFLAARPSPTPSPSLLVFFSRERTTCPRRYPAGVLSPLLEGVFSWGSQIVPLRIGLAFNLKPAEEEEPPSPPPDDLYAEWDDPATISAVAEALALVGEVILLEADETFPERLRRISPDILFNIAEGLRGPAREAQVPAICEFFGVPYTGSDPLTLALGLDKERTKEVLVSRGVRTPRWAVVGDEIRNPSRHELPLPAIVKPLHEGSSKGIDAGALCRTPEEVEARVAWIRERYRQPSLVEEFLPGREFTAAMLGNGTGTRVLPLVEIALDTLPPGAPPIYGWEAKWVWDTPEAPLSIFRCPAKTEGPLAEEIRRTALAAFHALGCRDWARVDLRLDAQGRPHILEVNPLPGILPDPRQNSCFPKAARAAGLAYPQMILAVLGAAMDRWGMPKPPTLEAFLASPWPESTGMEGV